MSARAAHFTLLARIVTTLASGQAVSLPFIPGPRGFDWSETFKVGEDRANQGQAVLHSTSTRRGGEVKVQRAEPCFWSLDDALQSAVEWDAETLAFVEAQLLPPAATPTVAKIIDFAKGEAAMIAGTKWTVDAAQTKLSSGSQDAQWTLDETVAAVRSEI